ncbi:hypothetical protein CYLTODRAFT_422931 [Cylindrobasidium torrendii FP15055 ss-10]|uniref:F-box domain-containing protein n=1 Tax=Cylindrobasidium torrendii FP15055 ss-10 TaxID=1314674 RepID=A0A0D7B8U5_9AGAR|nr:hypothetical protein CYLTODRAFT_422931 [Cylindrobasidium torrendii FP15055 ss-10]
MDTSDACLLRILRKELPPLPDGDAAQMKSCVLALEEEIDSLERQILVFAAVVNNLQRTLTVSKSTLALRRAVIAPIHRLPQELLVAVFQHCIPQDHTNLACLGESVRWILLRVCRSWKSVLEGAPTLWTNLVISPETRPLTQPLKKYLSLSGRHPLWVTIRDREDKPVFEDSRLGAAFWQVLSSTMHRWQRLRIYCVSTPVDDIIMYLMPLNFPMLEEVYIWVVTERADPREPSGMGRSWFKNAPRLKRAMLEFAVQRSYAWYPPSLTHMCSELEENGSMLEYALSFPNLRELIFKYEDYTNPLPSLQHHALTHLCTSGTTLRYLTLPSLKSLVIDDSRPYHTTHGYPPSAWADGVTTFIRRSKCRLEYFHILAPTLLQEKATYTELLPLVGPTLVMLNFTSDRHSHPSAIEIIRSLTRTLSSPGSLPYLEHLKVSFCSRDPQDRDTLDALVDAFATTLISRRNEKLAEQWHAPLLRKVSVDWGNNPLVSKMRTSCLDLLLCQGMEVEWVRYPDQSLTDWHTTWYDETRR